VIPDEESMIKDKVKDLLKVSDIVITIGGSSVGSRDLTFKVLKSLNNAKILFRGVLIRPGRPATALVVNDGKLIFIASGFPVAALAEVDLILLPAIKKVLNIKELGYPIVRARLTRRLVNVVGYTSYVRVKVFKCGNELCVEPLRLTGSGVLSTLIKGNGVIVIPPNIEGYEKGSYVNVRLVNPIEEPSQH